MTKQGVVFFTPHIGDTILATGLAQKFSRDFGKPVSVAAMTEDVMDFAVGKLGGTVWTSPETASILRQGKDLSAIPLHKEYNAGNRKYLFYVKDNRKLVQEIEALLLELAEHGYDELFILHYSYPLALLGTLAKRNGFAVKGYSLDEDLVYLNFESDHVLGPAKIWSEDYIGDRLAKWITGTSLDRQADFPYLQSNGKRTGTATVFPTTRSLAANAGNWARDIEVLQSEGVPVRLMWHNSEDPPEELVGRKFDYSVPSTVLGSHGLEFMLETVASSKFIVCYDSAAFHLAWLTNTPAIVKLKGGFNREWVPTWLTEEELYYYEYFFIPATPMYEEEYEVKLRKGLRYIGVI